MAGGGRGVYDAISVHVHLYRSPGLIGIIHIRLHYIYGMEVDWITLCRRTLARINLD